MGIVQFLHLRAQFFPEKIFRYWVDPAMSPLSAFPDHKLAEILHPHLVTNSGYSPGRRVLVSFVIQIEGSKYFLFLQTYRKSSWHVSLPLCVFCPFPKHLFPTVQFQKCILDRQVHKLWTHPKTSSSLILRLFLVATGNLPFFLKCLLLISAFLFESLFFDRAKLLLN